MVKNFIYKFYYLYLFIIQINPIYPFISSLEEEKDILFIYPKSKYHLYYFTFTDMYLLNNQVKNTLATQLNIMENSGISILNSSKMTFIITCSTKNLLEIINSNGLILNKIPYNSYERGMPPFKCPLHYINNILYYAYAELGSRESKIKCIYNEINSENNEIGNIYRESKYITFGNNYLPLSIKKIVIECFNWKGNLFIIYRDDKKGICNSLEVIEEVNSHFKLITNDENEFMVYYYTNQLKIFYMNITSKYYFEIKTQYDFNFTDFSMIKINENNLFSVYKSKENNNLIVETFYVTSFGYESFEYFEIENIYGYSINYIQKTEDNDYLIFTKGNIDYKKYYEYFTKNDLENFKNSIFNECTEINKFLTSSNKKIEININDIFIKKLNLNDEILFYPKETIYSILNSTHIEIIINEEYGEIELYYTGIKTKINDIYNITYEKRSPQCKFIIQICNEACLLCNEVKSKNENPTKCFPKRCKNGYKYLINDETECIIQDKECYEKCNSCYEMGNNIDNKCESCKYGYEKFNSNCIICDKRKKYFYYDPSVNINECLYGNNKCPSKFPYLIEETGECVNICPNKFSLNIEDKKCLEPLYYIDENNNKQLINNNKCNEDYPFLMYKTRRCIKNCFPNYFLIDNSFICIENCENINLISYNQNCICQYGNIKIISNEKIICNNVEQIIEDLFQYKENEDKIKYIENNLNILKHYDDIIIKNEETKIQVLNSSLINGFNSISPLGGIDLKNCENILKEKYNLISSEPLLIMLINSPSNLDSSINNLNYNVYSQNGQKLDLSLCSNVKISIYNSIKENSKININLINHLEENEIEFFDINSNFYQDKCFSFNLNNNDITIKDRRKDIYPVVSICEPECNYIEYNEEKNIVKCDCNIKMNFESISKNETSNFFKSINNQINFHLIVCYNVFKFFKSNFYKNIGFWFWFISFLNLIIGFIIYLSYIKNKFYKEVYSNFKNKTKSNPPKNRNLNINDSNLIEQSTQDKKSHYQIELQKNNKLKKVFPIQLNQNNKNNLIKISHLKSSSIHFKTTIYSKEQSSIDYSKNDKNIDSTQTERNLVSNVNNPYIYKNHKKGFIIGIKNEFKNKSFHERLNLKYSNLFIKNDNDNYWDMNYKNAVESDDRYFFHYYFSFLFLKIEFINIIFYSENYEYYVITIPFYLLSLLFDFTLNAFFYSDDIVHQKYSNEGKLYFITQFLLGLISNFITFIIMKYLKKFITYSFAFETLNNEEKNKSHYISIAAYLLNITHKKLIICFILEIILCCFCGYYIYIFCEIYHQSQISLLINFLTGMVTSIIIALFITLIVCILRKIALKCENKKIFYSSKYIGDLI